MAILKSLKQKDKEYIFKSFGNSEFENPAKIIFARFPQPDETFPTANQKSILESSIIKEFDNSQKSKEKLVEHIINVMIDNITANRINYEKFFEECVSHIENLEYESKEIKTVKEFLELPKEAFYAIASEAYLYSKENDLFTIEEKKI